MAAAEFTIAVFVIDGQLEATAAQRIADLDPRWTENCRRFLAEHGRQFKATWPGNLAHITTHLTAASGVALATFLVRDRVAASLFLSRSMAPAVEAQVMDMFIQSLRAIPVVKKAAATATPFSTLATLHDRPLMAVVPWPDDAIDEQSHAVVTELSKHFAAAFLCFPDAAEA